MFIRSMKLLFKVNGGELFKHLFEKIMSLVFFGLNETFQVCAQIEILSKSLFSCLTVSAGSVPLASREQSSAKTNIRSLDH